jgi:hypothetical protein
MDRFLRKGSSQQAEGVAAATAAYAPSHAGGRQAEGVAANVVVLDDDDNDDDDDDDDDAGAGCADKEAASAPALPEDSEVTCYQHHVIAFCIRRKSLQC